LGEFDAGAFVCDANVENVAELALVLCLSAGVQRRAEAVVHRADVVIAEDGDDVVSVDA